MRRHTLGVGLSAALVAMLIGFTTTVYLQSLRIKEERDVADAERTIAESQRERAEAVSSFLIDSFRLADPFSEGGNSVTARQILDNGATRIGSELSKQPAVKADVLDTIGSAYLGLGLPEEAQPLIEAGLTLRRSLFGGDSEAVANSLYSLNRVYEKKGDLNRAEDLAKQSLAINQQKTGPASAATAASLCRLGVIHKEKDELATAEKLFQSCLDIRRAQLGHHDESLTTPLDNLAQIASHRGDNALAEKYLNQALEIDRRTRSEEHPQYIRHLLRLALVTHDRGASDRAEPLFRRAVELSQRVLGPEHPETIDAMSTMGTFQMESGRLEAAEQTLSRVLEINRRLRPDHFYVGNDLENLGRLAFRKQDFPRAERYLNEALAVYREKLPPTSGFIASTLTILGHSQIEQRRPRDAIQPLTEAIAAWRAEYGENSAGYAIATATLARAQTLLGNYTEAEPALRAAYPLLNSSTRVGDREMADDIRHWIEDLYRDMGRPDAARQYFASLPKRTSKP